MSGPPPGDEPRPPRESTASGAAGVEGPDLARTALARARERAAGLARGRPRAAAPARRPARPPGEPVTLGAALDQLLADRGWDSTAAAARVVACWPEIVGPDIAGHAVARSLTDGRLVVEAESTAWATQLRLLAPSLLERIAAATAPGVVRHLVVHGPSGPNWRHGPRRVRGGRGPRDTYG